MTRFSRRMLLGSAIGGTMLSASPRPARATPAGTLSMGLVNYPPNIRAFEATGSSAAAVKMMLFRGLLSYDLQGRLVPELAESWTPDGPAAHLFRLRGNATFHTGEKVTAEDVKYTFEQIVAANSTAFLRQLLGIIDRIEVQDALSLRIVLKQPSAPFPHLLASSNAPVLSAKLGDINAPVGAGPYRFVAQERGVAVEVERFKDFYKPGLPRAPRIRFIAYGDENLRTAALESGDVDIIEGVPWQSIEALGRKPGLRLESTLAPFMHLIFNARTGPFADPRVRQATGFAIRREEIVKSAMFGLGAPLTSLPYPPGTPFANPPTGGFYGYDPARARRLLAEAGLPNGFRTRLLATSSPILHQATAEVVQQHLAEIGIQAELVLPEWAGRVAMGNRGQYEFAIMGSAGDYPDPDSLSTIIGTGPTTYGQTFGFTSKRIDALLEAGRRQLDLASRQAIYADLQTAVAEEAPFVGLAWRSQAYGMQRAVQGYHNMPGFLTFYSPITLEDTTAA